MGRKCGAGRADKFENVMGRAGPGRKIENVMGRAEKNENMPGREF